MIFLIVLLGNLWIWKILQVNFLIFLLLLVFTTCVYLYQEQKLKVNLLILLSLIVSLFYFQWQTTNFHSLILRDNDEQRIETQRRKFYNPGLDITRKVFYKFSLVDYLEGDINTVLTRIERNFFETIDPNVYFFGGHPRERVWVSDFEKFPFILIIPFFVGLYKTIEERNRLLILISVLGMIFLSIIGHDTKIGPFLLFPTLVLLVTKGVKILWNLKRF